MTENWQFKRLLWQKGLWKSKMERPTQPALRGSSPKGLLSLVTIHGQVISCVYNSKDVLQQTSQGRGVWWWQLHILILKRKHLNSLACKRHMYSKATFFATLNHNYITGMKLTGVGRLLSQDWPCCGVHMCTLSGAASGMSHGWVPRLASSAHNSVVFWGLHRRNAFLN